jgi:acyl carrier protein
VDIQSIVYEQVTHVAQEQGKTLAPLSDEMRLLDSGLDSLCIAILVANLEDRTGLDPFGSGDDIDMPATLGELVRIYEDAAVKA